jgi:cell division protein FtsW (lipid II flippase)
LVPVRNGARAWIDLGVMAFQPAELAKVTFVLAMAWYLRHRSSYRTVRGLLVPLGLLMVPIGLILQQPDLGTAVLFVPALGAMLVAAGARLDHLGALVGAAGLLLVVNVAAIYVLPDSLQVLRPYQRERIRSMISQSLGDDRYIQDSGYQQHKAMTLVGAGGFRGYGDRSATIVRFNRLPNDHNDMIFAVVVNRWGLVGGLGVLALYGLLFGAMMAVAAATHDPFARLVTVGFAGLLFSQAAINIAIVLGLLPVTGITLPLVSYGGSSLAATMAMVGLVVNFGSRRAGMLNWPSFEFGGKA